MIKINAYRNLYLALSGILVAAAVVAIAVFGFHPGIDFTGGTLWQIRIAAEVPTTADLEQVLRNDLKLEEPKINFDPANQTFLVRLGEIPEDRHQQYLAQLKTKYASLEELSFQSIGPSVSEGLKKNAYIAIALVLVGISLYIAFAFRKISQPVSSWKYGWITLLTLFHDVAIPAGLLAILGRFGGVEIDTNFIVALLVVMGFSVHDTIVVFDRIRENLFSERGKAPFGEIVDKSVNQTVARSINTSLTLILVLIALYFTGPENLKYFILTLLVGVVTGIYSSIFVASPALLLLSPKARKG